MGGGGGLGLSPGQSHYFSASEWGYHDAEGDSLDHITILSLPTQGSLSLYSYYPVSSGQSIDSYALNSGYLVYTPDSNAPASYTTTFAFTVNDGQDNSVPASFTLNVGVTSNTPPTVAGSVHSLPATSSKTITTADLGYADADGNQLQSITVTALPTTGSLLNYGYPVSVGSTIDAYQFSYGTVVYQPSTTATASFADLFSFTASDGTVSSSPAAIGFNVSVTPNAAPLVTGSVVAVASGINKTLTLGNLGYSDPEGDLLQSITITALPITGTLTLYGYPITVGTNITPQYLEYGYLAYAPDANNHSAHTAAFSFTATDGHHSSTPGTVTFNVAGNANTAPVTANHALAVPETGTFTLTAGNFAFSDTDGDDLDHITILSLPSQGTLTIGGYPVTNGQSIDSYALTSGYLVYTPNSIAPASYSTSFAFSVSDGQVNSSSASLTLNVTITPNAPPTVTGAAYSLPSTGSKTISTADLGYSDADGDQLQVITITVLPTSGTLLRSGYPVAVGATINAYEISYGSIVYQPDATATTSYVDTFSFTASDGHHSSSPGTVTFNGTGNINTAPVTANIALSIPRNGTLTLTSGHFPYSDDEGAEKAHITILSLPSQGTLSLDGYPVSSGQSIDSYAINNGYLVYASNSNAPASYSTSFTFSVNDGQVDSLPASLTINASAASGTPPTITGSVLSISSTGAKTIATADLGYSAGNGNALQSITVTVLPASGTLLRSGNSVSLGATISANEFDYGSIVYQPSTTATAAYADTLSFTASDGATSSATVSIVFNVSATASGPASGTTNVAPSVTGSAVAVTSRASKVITLSNLGYSDPEGDLLQSTTITSLPTTGTLSLNGYPVAIGTNITDVEIDSGHLAFTPDATNPSAHVATFSFTASDGHHSTTSATITFNVAASSAPPTPSLPSRVYAVHHSNVLNIDVSRGVLGFDAAVASAVLVDDVTSGSLTLNNDGSFAYLPAAVGTFRFTYARTTATTTSAPVTVEIEVWNLKPVGNDDVYIVESNTSLVVSDGRASRLGVLANDWDNDADPLTVSLVTDVAHGLLNLNPDGTFNYLPNAGYNGIDSFIYQLSDPAESGNQVHVDLVVWNGTPVANHDFYNTFHDAPLNVPASGILANDFDGDHDGLTVIPTASPQHGTLAG